MACNENVIKNMATEATRNCQAKNVSVEVSFVVYLIEFLLLNPKYGKLFTKTLNRNNLEYFVNECVTMLTSGDTSIRTLKMQFIIYSNYDKPDLLIEKHLHSIETCLKPLVNEILETEPTPEAEDALQKLYRKISIYIVLASGLGNPGVIVNLKEGIQALESVFSMEDLSTFVTLTRYEKMPRLKELVDIVSGVRLFNKNCKLTGDQIPDLPNNLMDAGRGCIQALSHALIAVMQRVNTLTTAITDCIAIDEETGNVNVEIAQPTDLSVEQYLQIFDLLAFNRQYEMFVRKLLSDMQVLVDDAADHVESFGNVLSTLDDAVKYKDAVPVTTVFPLFSQLWEVWRSMQNIMYVVSVVNLLLQNLIGIQDRTKIPQDVVFRMLRGRLVVTDQDRMISIVTINQRLSLLALPNYEYYGDNAPEKDRLTVQYLGFCAMCLVMGALVPSSPRIGVIKHNGKRYGFCCYNMALKFSKDPQRYVNEVVNYARNNPHIINLLNIIDDVREVKDVDQLVVKVVSKVKILDQEVQTEAHPIEEYKDRNYSWDLWEWKRRACQWATIVNCRTHSTQTNYSHLRSEIHCQTTEPRDKCHQTKRDAGMNTNTCNFFIWGLRGQRGDGQHSLSFVQPHGMDKKTPQQITTCNWPCVGSERSSQSSISESHQVMSFVIDNIHKEESRMVTKKRSKMIIESKPYEDSEDEDAQ